VWDYDGVEEFLVIIRKRNPMPTKGPVNVNRQTIYAIIPGLDYRAAKQIDKLTQFVVIGFSIWIGVGFGGYEMAHLLDQYNLGILIIIVIITSGVYFPIVAYLVRKWSVEWNEKFDK